MPEHSESVEVPPPDSSPSVQPAPDWSVDGISANGSATVNTVTATLNLNCRMAQLAHVGIFGYLSGNLI